MRLLDRYLFRQTLLPVTFCLGGFVSLTVIIEVFGHLDEIMKKQIPWSVVARYYGLFSASVIVIALPLAILLTVTFVLGNLHRYNEITAMRASGVSLRRILAPFLVLGLVGAALIFGFNEYVIPRSTLRYEQMHEQYFEDDEPTKQPRLQANLTLLGQGNRLYHAQSFDPDTDTLHDVTILEHDDLQRLTGKIYAQRAQWDGRRWMFYDGFTFKLDPRGNALGDVQRFREQRMYLAEEPDDFSHADVRPELMRFFQLRLYLDQLQNISAAARQRLEVELAYKLSIPWTCVIMALLGAPFSLRRRGGVLTGMGMSILLGIMYYALFAVCVALGKGGSLAPWVAVWLPHITFAPVGCMLLWKLR